MVSKIQQISIQLTSKLNLKMVSSLRLNVIILNTMVAQIVFQVVLRSVEECSPWASYFHVLAKTSSSANERSTLT